MHIFGNFYQNREFDKFLPKSRFSKKNLKNQDFPLKFWPISRIPTVLTKYRYFLNFWQEWRFSKNFTKMNIFRKFRPKSRFSEKLDQKRDFWKSYTEFWCGDKNGIGRYVIHDFIMCYSLWVDAMYFELQHFRPFHCSSSVRTHHQCSNLAICIAIIFHRFYENNCS